MTFTKGEPPGPHAEDISPVTEMLRPPIRLTPEQLQAARRQRRAGRELREIATRLAVPEEEVRQALAAMRTKKPIVTRRSLNVTLAAHEFVVGEAFEGEPCWETVDRLFGELALRRAFAVVPVTRGGPDLNKEG